MQGLYGGKEKLGWRPEFFGRLLIEEEFCDVVPLCERSESFF